jgi:endonuclease/exonuclease/phosphatase family metal-dependent hydrolase
MKNLEIDTHVGYHDKKLLLDQLREANMRMITKTLLGCGIVVCVSSSAPVPLPGDSTSVNVMSFNIRYNNPDDGENAWPHRKELVANTILFHRADLVGVQEALKGQLDDLSILLPDYAWLGKGRDDGGEKGEYSAILYRKGRFDLLQSGTFWLSEAPERPGSIGWDAAITRVVTWAKFEDKYSSKEFYLFNTHFDHIGERARQESAKLILKRIQDLAAATGVIVTGDFNSPETSPAYQTLTGAQTQATLKKEAFLFDTRSESNLPHFGPAYTFHGFGQATERTRIDYIFVSRHFKVLRHAALAEPVEGRYASDHLPVLAEVDLE